MPCNTRSKLFITRLLTALSLSCFGAGFLCAQSLTLVSGNGQVVQEQFISNASMVVQAKDAAGRPASGVAVNWSITQGEGTLNFPSNTTDANGLASTKFLATNVPGGLSFFASTVTASTAFGSVNFVITTALLRQANGDLAAPPVVQLVTPDQTNLNITAPSGSTVPGGVVVLVIAVAGPQTGQPVPNVGLRIVNYNDPTAAAPASCNGPNGLVFTDNTGTGTCDLMVSGPAVTTQIAGYAGEYQYTTPFLLHVTPGAACSYSLSAGGQTFPSNGGSASVTVITTSGCGWTATSNANWITITSGASGTGSGTVAFTIAANTGPARNGTLTIAGQTYTVNQNAGTPGGLAITTSPNLPSGTIGISYSATISATGGSPPYNWSASGSLPPGLALSASQGVISGKPTGTGTYQFTITVRDNIGAQQSQNFSVTINSTSSSSFAINNTSFPSGMVGQPYRQLLTATGGCVTPFSPQPVFSLSGGTLPNGLSIQTNSDLTRSIAGTPASTGTFNFTLTATDSCAKTATASFTITITGTVTSPQMTVNPASIPFTVQSGGGNVPADQTVAIGATSGAFNYSAVIATNSGGNWLIAKSVTTGTTPGSITVGLASFSNLPPGPYTGSITITSQASNSPVVIQVTLTVLVAPTLTVSPSSFTVNQTGASGSTVTRQTLVVNSTPSTHFTASATTATGVPWLSVSLAQGDTPGTVVAIVNAAGLAAGSYSGLIAITPTGGAPQTVTITLNVLPPATLVAAPAPLAFTYQQGDPSPAGQTIALNSTGVQLNVSISVAMQSGNNWLFIDRPNGATPMSLRVSVNPAGLAPSFYAGTLTVTATDPSVAPLTVGITLTVTQALPAIRSVTNAASFAPAPVAPGEFVTIFGTSLGPATLTMLQFNPSGTVATNLAGTQVFFDNIAAPIIYTSATQVTVIVPYEVAGNTTTRMQVQYQGVLSDAQILRVIDSSPGIFMADASGQGAILNQDTSPNSIQNGAAPGSVISIYCTGEGQTDPPGVDGMIADDVLPKPRLRVSVQIDSLDADIQYFGAAPGLAAGVMQVNAVVPKGVRRGTSVPVLLIVGGASSQAGVTVAITPSQ